MGIKLQDQHVWPRDQRASMVFFKDWLSGLDCMSDADFRMAIHLIIEYGTEGKTAEEIADEIKGLDRNLYHPDILLFFLMGIKGSIDKGYDNWMAMANGKKKGKNYGKNIQS